MKFIHFLSFICMLGFATAYVQNLVTFGKQQDVALNSERNSNNFLSANSVLSEEGFPMSLPDNMVVPVIRDENFQSKNYMRNFEKAGSNRKKCKPRKCNCNCSTTGPSHFTTAASSTRRITTLRTTNSTTPTTTITTTPRPTTTTKGTTEDFYEGDDTTDYPDYAY